MEHNYHWTKTTVATDCYTISWYDGSTLLCQTQTKIVGPAAEVETAIQLAAEQLRKENPALFPEETDSTEEGIMTMNMEEEVYG